MNTLALKIKRFCKQVLGLFPSSLPNGLVAFNAWADDIIATYDMPTQDTDSIRFTLATIIMHQGQTVAYRSKFHFVLTLRAGAAKQVAGAVFYDIKNKQKAAEEASKLAEATAIPAVGSNGQHIRL